MRKIIHFLEVMGFLLGAMACVEELDIEGVVENEGVGLLVVEASLTDNMERQKVYLSRTDARFDLVTDTTYNRFVPLGIGPRDSVNVERDAIVSLTGDDGSEHFFTEVGEQGTYLSNSPFALNPNVSYALKIETSDGVPYESRQVSLNASSEITDVYAERTVSDLGVEGIQIYVDSEADRGNPKNFRFSYDETYKIVAPFWNEEDFLLENYDPCALPVPTYDLSIVPREVQNQICYNTVSSNTVIQTTLNNTGNNDIVRFPVRFIGRDNFVISHRYSILVRLHVQSNEAFAFYETVKEFSEAESLFSQIQPGALLANVSRMDDKSENVLGYVEAVSTSEKRIFFNYDDFFPGEALPPYPVTCFEESSPESHRSFCASGPDAGNPCPQSIIERVNLGLITYTGNNTENIGACPGPFKFVTRICGDCTLLGSNVVPEFWVEE